MIEIKCLLDNAGNDEPSETSTPPAAGEITGEEEKPAEESSE